MPIFGDLLKIIVESSLRKLWTALLRARRALALQEAALPKLGLWNLSHIANTREASNPPIDPYYSQRTHTRDNRRLLDAKNTLELNRDSDRTNISV
jgi:hypothetical protein